MVQRIPRSHVWIGVGFVLWSSTICQALNLANGIFGMRPRITHVDEFVLAISSHPGFESRLAAGRASRLGLESYVVTSKFSSSSEAEALRAYANETWMQFKGKKLTDILPFEVYKHIGPSFQWMFVGEDDTLFFLEAAQRAVQGLDPEQPHFVTDEAWFVVPEKGRHVSKAEAPQCVPCSYAKDMTLLPGHFHRACPYCNVSGPILPHFCGPEGMPSMKYGPHGGPGYLISVGLLKKVSYSYMQKCLASEKDIYLARCLWKFGIGATDPDPLWHPDRLTHFDPTPPPYLTHESIMEKLSFALGRLLRLQAGVCQGLCKEEVDHMVSLHVNGARLGFTQWGDSRVGVFKDAGQREFAGQIILRAVSRFIHDRLPSEHTVAKAELQDLDGETDGPAITWYIDKADARIAEALWHVKSNGELFRASLEETVVKFDRLNARLVEAMRSRVAAKLASNALLRIQQDVVLGRRRL